MLLKAVGKDYLANTATLNEKVKAHAPLCGSAFPSSRVVFSTPRFFHLTSSGASNHLVGFGRWLVSVVFNQSRRPFHSGD